jgi:pectinesterase
MKYVLYNCRFDGVPGWNLARHHVDAQFYFIDCTFSQTMADKPIRRVIYPLGSAPATDADIKRNADLDKQNQWGERAYYFNCNRDGGNYDWFKNNLDQAPGSPTADQLTAAWTFDNKWNPERTTGPTIQKITPGTSDITLTFSESVTVKGRPRLAVNGGGFADYTSGSGTDQLTFKLPGDGNNTSTEVKSIDLDGGAIVASQADAVILPAALSLPQN